MQFLNNLDIIILLVIAISSFLSLSRGFTKELFSIIGWILIIVLSLFLSSIINEIVARYVENVTLISLIVLFFILFTLWLFWMFFTGKVTGKVRDSKLSYFDRIFGLVFGFTRGVLLVVLFAILVNWLVPKSGQPESFKDSIYFEMATKLGKPLEKLIPESTLINIHEKSAIGNFIEDISAEGGNEEFFEDLSQPKIKKSTTEKTNDMVDSVAKELDEYVK